LCAPRDDRFSFRFFLVKKTPHDFRFRRESWVFLRHALISSGVFVVSLPAAGSSCHNKTAPQIGFIDFCDRATVIGWAADLTAPAEPARLYIVIDGQIIAALDTNLPRDDVRQAGIESLRPGFRFSIPEQFLDGVSHRLMFRFRSGVSVLFLDEAGETFPEWTFRFEGALPVLQSSVDGVFGSTIRGWAIRDYGDGGRKAGNLTLQVTVNGMKTDRIKADLFRPDVAEALGCEQNCGFAYSLPAYLRTGAPLSVQFYTLPEEHELIGSPLITRLVRREEAEKLQELYTQVEDLCAEIYAVKDRMRVLTFRDEFSLDTYHKWAERYFPALRFRTEHDPGREATLSCTPPLVSVICPVYRTAPAYLIAMIDSVRAQTWTHWELILVDDDSRAPELMRILESYAALDPRIVPIVLHTSARISGATNAGLRACQGDYVAFLDHDDLLVDVALEVMVRAALTSGARLLYSDEDTLTPQGFYTDPHLKPDWNPRLLLCYNYLSHLMMVERGLLEQVGPLDSRMEGAQDYDLVLRTTERLDPAQIIHVPEILYHARISPESAASGMGGASGAVEAGRVAIQAHLSRRNIPAEAVVRTEPYGYQLRWHGRVTPKVSILIPYREQIPITRRCVETILTLTDYPAYEIVLIDNWSTTEEARDFAVWAENHTNIRVISLEEKFNYARINNLAFQSVRSEFVLFLNNDVFVGQRDWLYTMVSEAMADPDIGAVGARLLYPNQTVQHAGVILGVGGVADHAHRGMAAGDPGYLARAICSQDLSAVTAACMLVRRSVFQKVGGFDEKELGIAFNDTDLCLKIRAHGYRILFVAEVEAEHHESLSRGNDAAPPDRARFFQENQTMRTRWRPILERDPAYNPHFHGKAKCFGRYPADHWSICSPHGPMVR
jgi:GT2 family glycosyltransferase